MHADAVGGDAGAEGHQRLGAVGRQHRQAAVAHAREIEPVAARGQAFAQGEARHAGRFVHLADRCGVGGLQRVEVAVPHRGEIRVLLQVDDVAALFVGDQFGVRLVLAVLGQVGLGLEQVERRRVGDQGRGLVEGVDGAGTVVAVERLHAGLARRAELAEIGGRVDRLRPNRRDLGRTGGHQDTERQGQGAGHLSSPDDKGDRSREPAPSALLNSRTRPIGTAVVVFTDRMMMRLSTPDTRSDASSLSRRKSS